MVTWDFSHCLSVQMKNGKEFLLTDTVGFIQKLPTTLVRPSIYWWFCWNHFLPCVLRYSACWYCIFLFSINFTLLLKKRIWRVFGWSPTNLFFYVWQLLLSGCCLQSYIGGDIRIIAYGACGGHQVEYGKPVDEILLDKISVIIYCYELQPSSSRATDWSCGEGSVRTRCVINFKVDGMEQGKEIFSWW